MFGFSVVSSLELHTGFKSEKRKAYNQEMTVEAFEKFVEGINKGKGKLPVPTVTQLVYFNIFKTISELNKEAGKADYMFYKEKTVPRSNLLFEKS